MECVSNSCMQIREWFFHSCYNGQLHIAWHIDPWCLIRNELGTWNLCDSLLFYQAPPSCCSKEKWSFLRWSVWLVTPTLTLCYRAVSSARLDTPPLAMYYTAVSRAWLDTPTLTMYYTTVSRAWLNLLCLLNFVTFNNSDLSWYMARKWSAC